MSFEIDRDSAAMNGDNVVQMESDRPEDYTVSPEGTTNVDALHCTLGRARAVVMLLQSDGMHEGVEGFSLDHRYVMDALSSLEGMIDQAEQLVG